MLATRAAPVALVVLGTAFVLGALVLLDVVGGIGYTASVTVLGLAAALVAALLTRARAVGVAWARAQVDVIDLGVMLVLYAAVVIGFRLAFTVFTTDNTLGLFLAFGSALLVGVVGPVVYTIWFRHRSMASLGIGLGNWRLTAALALAFGGVQFALTLARLDWPAPDVWLPQLVMALTVGLFEAILFRGFIQNRLEAAFGLVPAVAASAGLYGLYHVGYGMGASEIGFLVGLGVVYAVAFRLAGSIAVLWPLLTPLGALFNQLQAGDIALPMESILGFADVLGLMFAAIWFAHRYEGRHPADAVTHRLSGAHL
jgi:hypothetical protein